MLYDNEQFQVDGFTFRVNFENDVDYGSPWENDDGHGPVSEWTRRDKRPGELVLCSDRGSKRFYDYQAAVKTARVDGWDCPPYKQGTKGERAARAARADYDRLRAWYNDQWQYIGVVVHLLDDDGEEVDSASLWGIESDAGEYLEEVARDLAADMIAIAKAQHEQVDAALSVQEEDFRVC